MKRITAVLIGVILFVVSGIAAERAHELTQKELKELLTKASTPQEHLRLAAHFSAKAKKYEAESAEHAEMARMYRRQPTPSEVKRPMAPDTAAHCEFIADNLAKAAKEARAIAAAHEKMAKE